MAERDDDEVGKGGKAGPPGWRFVFFALVILVILVGGTRLGIPSTVALPVALGALIALANGYLPTWFGKDK